MKHFIHTYKYKLLLALIILLQLAYITYLFTTREGYHSDENWSYGFANSYYQPHIWKDKDGNLTNFNQWTDSQVLRDYITVQEDEQFAYDSIYSNMSEDLSPPLHSMILHTICSLFPGTFSWWYAYIINIFSFILGMIGLYLFSVELGHSRPLALSICFFYGFTSAASNCFTFLRAYAFITAFAIFFCYLHCKMYNKGFQKITKQLILMGVIIILGGLSHYYFLALCACFMVFFAIHLFIRKNWKTALLYMGTMAASVGIIFLLFPPAIHMISGGNSIYAMHMPLIWEVKTCIQLLFNESLGIRVYFPDAVFWTIFKFVLTILAILIGGIFFLLRNESWFRKKVRRGFFKIKLTLLQFPRRYKACNHLYLLFFLAGFATLVIIAKIGNILMMGVYVDRYLFFLMPILMTMVACILYKCIQRLFKTKKQIICRTIFSCLLLAMLIINHIFYPYNYRFTRSCDATPIEELTNDASVIIVTSADWRLTCYTSMLRNSKNFYATSIDSFMESLDDVDRLENSDTSVYLILETDTLRPEDWVRDESLAESKKDIVETLTSSYTLKDIENQMSLLSWSTQQTFLQTEDSFNGLLNVYRLR